jgi:aryl-alcohol dehydrogenase-like predicted oxidoreductase
LKLNKFVLGGAQFGMNYGVTNINGAPTDHTLLALLDRARDAGIGLIDTAPAYGESEAVLGRLGAGKSFGFITKTLAGGSVPDEATLVSQFHRSISRLHQQSIHGLLFHDADVLASDVGTTLFEAACRLKDDGLVEKLGVSVYSSDQIDAVLAKYEIDLVQLPINLLDNRLVVSGVLDRLKDRGVEVHARSAFLQGVLLSPPEDLPEKVAKLRPYVKKFRERLADLNLSPVHACLGFLQSMDSIDRIVVGVTSASELAEILLAMESSIQSNVFGDLAINDASLLDPRYWG